ncbi:MAG: NUDIX hydrolase [Candidatus Altiarchaeota archaeon]|nr:NUDIX hydrolase [Candidatus Altiarchaeota archaeon]
MRQVAVDAVIVKNGKILLIKRAFEPFKGMWALPGGRLDDGETVERAAIREAKEETGFDIQLKYLIGVFSEPKRDPRGAMSIAFSAIVTGGEITPNKEAQDISWFPITDLPELAADHIKIIKKFIGFDQISKPIH